jgi:hypothetical protein
MTNPISWLVANPLASHVVFSAAETIALAFVLSVVGIPHGAIIAAVVVSAMFYGREAGQHEHDLKHAVPPTSPVMAALGSHFAFLWSRDNWLQWLVAAGATSAVAAALTLAGL